MIVRAQPLVSLVFLQQRSARSRPTMRSHFSPGVASLTELLISPAEISAPFAVLMEKLREIQIIKVETLAHLKVPWNIGTLTGELAFLCDIMDVIRQENIHIKKI